ncbi:MAG TPA: FHA domain-containing protein [candidate division Zixibacteria bacterium]|nr:FHA domain-containing protein [candidate division Zixibacteria bacterium]HEQ97954.1 FHA domain-containing protein [candidate division Zixibacteria bacterium]
MPEIIVKYDNKIIEKVVTEKPRISIGRTSDNDIVLDNRGVSRKHALIEFSPDSAIVIDNDSLNGTFVNDRKIMEETLKDKDRICIGKYELIFNSSMERENKFSDLDGTMLLQTKAHKERLKADKKQKEITEKLGCSVILEVNNKGDKREHLLDRDVVTFGKSKFCNIPIRGFWAPQIAAKVIREGASFTLANLGKIGYTKVNGEAISRRDLRNNDLIQIGRSFFKFIEAGA